MTDKERKAQFRAALATFLVNLQAGKGMALSLPSGVIPWATEWAALRQSIPGLGGYPTQEEAETRLSEWLNI